MKFKATATAPNGARVYVTGYVEVRIAGRLKCYPEATIRIEEDGGTWLPGTSFTDIEIIPEDE